MRELLLNAAEWRCGDDVYNAFFQAVGAPLWHGRNLDALRDSIAGGDINAVEVPYCIVILNSSAVGEAALQMMTDFIDLIRDLSTSGCPVDIIIDKPC